MGLVEPLGRMMGILDKISLTGSTCSVTFAGGSGACNFARRWGGTNLISSASVLIASLTTFSAGSWDGLIALLGTESLGSLAEPV